ncbi:MAG: hypothetical protein QXY52_06870, partial [Conexivisphaerales archaeon]
FPTINEFLPLKSIVRDYIVPLAITTFALFLLRAPLISAFPPSISIITGIINLIALLAAVSAVYLAVSVAISKNVRHIVRVLLKRL